MFKTTACSFYFPSFFSCYSKAQSGRDSKKDATPLGCLLVTETPSQQLPSFSSSAVAVPPQTCGREKHAKTCWKESRANTRFTGTREAPASRPTNSSRSLSLQLISRKLALQGDMTANSIISQEYRVRSRPGRLGKTRAPGEKCAQSQCTAHDVAARIFYVNKENAIVLLTYRTARHSRVCFFLNLEMLVAGGGARGRGASLSVCLSVCCWNRPPSVNSYLPTCPRRSRPGRKGTRDRRGTHPGKASKCSRSALRFLLASQATGREANSGAGRQEKLWKPGQESSAAPTRGPRPADRTGTHPGAPRPLTAAPRTTARPHQAPGPSRFCHAAPPPRRPAPPHRARAGDGAAASGPRLTLPRPLTNPKPRVTPQLGGGRETEAGRRRREAGREGWEGLGAGLSPRLIIPASENFPGPRAVAVHWSLMLRRGGVKGSPAPECRRSRTPAVSENPAAGAAPVGLLAGLDLQGGAYVLTSAPGTAGVRLT